MGGLSGHRKGFEFDAMIYRRFEVFSEHRCIICHRFSAPRHSDVRLLGWRQARKKNRWFIILREVFASLSMLSYLQIYIWNFVTRTTQNAVFVEAYSHNLWHLVSDSELNNPAMCGRLQRNVKCKLSAIILHRHCWLHSMHSLEALRMNISSDSKLTVT